MADQFRMRRRALLFWFGQAPADQLARAERDDFRRLWNKFAAAANDLMQGDIEHKWPIDKAREVEKLFDRVRRHPVWRA